MNREIKFRRAHFLYTNNSFECFTFWGPIKGGFQSPSSLSHCFYKEGTDMQFTGLHDKNGKEIYEGDIVEHQAGIGIIEWTKAYAGFSIVDYNELYKPESAEEVIGNIYENPSVNNKL